MRGIEYSQVLIYLCRDHQDSITNAVEEGVRVPADREQTVLKEPEGEGKRWEERGKRQEDWEMQDSGMSR